MHELASWPAHLPDAVVGVAPVLAEPLDRATRRPQRLVCRGHAEVAGTVDRIRELAVHVELQLPGRRVPDPDGGRALVAREPLELVLVEAALARDAVHDLQVLGIAGDGSDHPVAPPGGLLDVAGGHQRVEAERRIPDPAEPVVPVPDAAEELGQRRGGGGHDAAGGLVGQRLQRDQRPLDLVGPPAVVRGPRRPCSPPGLGLGHGGHRIGRGGWCLPRRVPGEGEPDVFVCPHREVGPDPLVLDRHGLAAAEFNRLGSRSGHDDRARPVDPRARSPVVEPRDAHGSHRHRPLEPSDEADEPGVPLAYRHAVDDADRAVGGLEVGLEHERAGSVPTRGRRHLARRCDRPRSVLIGAQQAGEAGRGVEPGEAEPIDRSVPADDGRRLRVTDHGVVLERQRHVTPPFANVRLARRGPSRTMPG